MSETSVYINKSKLAGAVILYHPDADLARNIRSYQYDVKKLYIVDNSETINESLLQDLFSQLNAYEYIRLQENKGIAYALNVAARKAHREGFQWLITMDQDSQASPQMIDKLITVSKELPMQHVGILAPQFIESLNQPKEKNSLIEVDVAITSGSIINLGAFHKIGPFRNEFFIDFVDHEFCLRLNLNGYKVIIANDISLVHKPGNPKKHTLAGYTVETSHHNFIRRYYITRNRLAVLAQFKDHFEAYHKFESTNNLRELIKVILFEDDKLRKVKSIYLGYKDFKNKKFGKYNY